MPWTSPLLGPRTGARPEQVREALIERVRTHWVDGVLRRSLHEAARIDLDLTVTDAGRPRAVDDDAAPEPVRPGARMVELYDRCGGAGGGLGASRLMLVLGEPGAGKTTMLLELADALLTRAATSGAPVPVVFNLSSWSGRPVEVRRRGLGRWMINELETGYRIPRAAAERLVTEDRIIVLLDGLDEVAADRREECVRAINRYRSTFEHTRVVVCCRVRVYHALGSPFDAAARFSVEPVRREQVERVLDAAGDRLAAVRAALDEDERLWELLASPLMLSVVALAYADAAVGSVEAGDCDGLLTTYVAEMLRRRPRARHEPFQVLHHMIFIASHLHRSSRVLFHWEQVQVPPDMAPGRLRAATALAAGVVVGAVAGLALGAAAGVAFGVLTGAALWFGAVLDVAGISRGPSEVEPRRRPDGAAIGVDERLLQASVVIAGGLLALMLSTGDVARHLSSASYFPALVWGVAVPAALVAGGIATPIGGRLRPTRYEVPGPWARARLSGGLWGTARGLLVASTVPLLLVGAAVSWDAGLRLGAAIAAATAVVGALHGGGYAVLEQLFLRRELDRRGVLALPLIPLLDYAVDCLLLRRVGDRYLFVHRSLQESLARRATDGHPAAAVEPTAS